MYPTSWVFTACNQSSCFVLAIWLSWNPVKFSCNWDFLVTTFLEENIEGTISCIPFCFPVESSLLFWALPSHKGIHLSLRSKGFALVSSGCCAAKSDGPSALLWEFWTFVTCPYLKCGFSFIQDVQLDGGWGFVSLLVGRAEAALPDGVLNPECRCSVLFMCCWRGTWADCFVPYFFPTCETKHYGCKGLLKSPVRMAAPTLCAWARVETGTFFCFVSAGAEFAPFFPEMELKDGLAGFSGQESTMKITMLVLVLVWISAVLCVFSALFWCSFCSFYPKEERVVADTPKGCLKSKASYNLQCRFVSLCTLSTTALCFRSKY